jgi:hypothetical protein
MLTKVALLFLLVMAALAIFGRWRVSRQPGTFCPHCGRKRVGAPTCVCGKGPG